MLTLPSGDLINHDDVLTTDRSTTPWFYISNRGTTDKVYVSTSSRQTVLRNHYRNSINMLNSELDYTQDQLDYSRKLVYLYEDSEDEEFFETVSIPHFNIDLIRKV